MGAKTLNEAGMTSFNQYNAQLVTLPTLKQRHLAKLREALAVPQGLRKHAGLSGPFVSQVVTNLNI